MVVSPVVLLAGPATRLGRLSSRRQALGDSLVVLLAGLALLALLAWLVDVSRIHINLPSFNDQVGYISVARNLVESGEWRSNLIYPSTLLQDTSRNYFYMPGHYAALAIAYRLFGFGVWQSLLPSLIGYVVIAVTTYLVGRRFFGRAVGLMAAGLIMLFAPLLIYTLSAMSELDRVAAFALAFALFVALPFYGRLALGPLLLVAALMFRETNAILLLPTTIILVAEEKAPRRYWGAALYVVLSLGLMALAVTNGPAAGRPSLIAALVFDNQFTTIHSDAVAQAAAEPESVSQWLSGLLTKMPRELLNAARNAWQAPLAFEVAYTGIIIALTVAVVWLGVARRQPFFLAAALGGAAHLLVIVTVYDRFGYGWLRILLGATPLLAVALAAALPRGRVMARLALLLLLAVMALASVRVFFARATAVDRQDDRRTAWLERLGHDDQAMLVAPHLFLPYVYRHHPVQWAFVPANDESLALLAARYPIGTLLLPANQLGETLSAEGLARAGLIQESRVAFGQEGYWLYRRLEPVEGD
jgi:4-amino-4-deoxy-L-arabinose transferase-like glycosyltransferase